MSFWSGIFRHHRRDANAATRRLYARVELAHTCVDFGAAVSFLIGSILFFFESLQTPATWLFTIGSVMFLMKPSLKLWREVQLYRMGKMKELAQQRK